MDAELLLDDRFALDERSFVQMKVYEFETLEALQVDFWKDVDTLWEARK
jgi:hypothetical protein